MFYQTKRCLLSNTACLFDNTQDNLEIKYEETLKESYDKQKLSPFQLFLRQADIRLTPLGFTIISFIIGITFCLLTANIFHQYLLPITFGIGFCIPFFVIEDRVRRRASSFSADYPSVLLATASSLKVGLTPYQALEKSVDLLDNNSLIKKEVKLLLDKIHNNQNKESAINQFALFIRLPELDLFRSALKLVLENGGRFSPTLNRLASVSSNRTSQIRTAEVTTATMRMTANILLLVAPVLLTILSLRSENFWSTIIQNPTANLLASIGSAIILCCYFILNRMSHFKP